MQVLVFSRLYDAPRDVVFRAWTEVDHLKHWWGPKGFIWDHATIDLHPGGVFHYCLRTPDGDDLWGKFVFRDIKTPERLMFVSSFSDKDSRTIRHPVIASWPLEIMNTLTLTEQGGKTALTLRAATINATPDEQKTFQESSRSIEEGMRGTLDQLGDYLASRYGSGSAAQDWQIVIERVFDAPRETVWKLWTTPELLKQWWGPASFITPVSVIDFRKGGRYLHCMESSEGMRIWSTGVFREIAPLERIVMTDSFSDESGKIVPSTRYGMNPAYPLEMLITVTLKDYNAITPGMTKLTLTHTGKAGISEAEIALMRQGWSESFDKCSAVLKNLKGESSRAGTKITVDRGRREIHIEREFDTPRDFVFRAFTDKQAIAHWWGPARLTTIVGAMDVRVGGSWRYIQEDPAGQRFVFSGTYTEIEPPERLVSTFEYDGMPDNVVLQILNLSEHNHKTHLTQILRYRTLEDLDRMYATGLEDGAKESMERLAVYLTHAHVLA